jgi:PAS domain S-box-containing protein
MTARKPRVAPPEGDSIAEALRRQALIVEHLYDGVIVTDSDGVILDWNPAAERLFGYSRGEVIGRTAELLNRPGEGPALSRAIRAGLKVRGCGPASWRSWRRTGPSGRWRRWSST